MERHIPAGQARISQKRHQAADENLYRSISRIIGMAGRLLETELSAEQRALVESMRRSVDALFTIAYDANDFPTLVDEDDEAWPASARSSSAHAVEKRPNASSLCALVVDDQPVACKILVGCLGSLGIRANSASTAPEALTMLRDAATKGEPYKLAFIDYRMTGFTGLELGKAISSNPTLAETRIVLVSAYEKSDIGNAAVDQTFAAYVQKPIQTASVRKAIETALRAN